MRQSALLASAAVMALSATAVGMSQAQAAPTVKAASSDARADAIAAAKSHAGATRFGAGQGAPGRRHGRRRRRHQPRAAAPHLPRPPGRRWRPGRPPEPRGRLEERQPDPPGPAQPATTPSRDRGRGRHQGARAQQGHHAITGDKVEESTLVVDATGATPRLAWRVLSGGTQANGTPSRLATYVDAHLRQGPAHRAGDRQRRRHRQHALQRHRPAERHPVGLDLPAQERRRPRQHLHHRHGQRRGLDALPDLRLAAARPAP